MFVYHDGMEVGGAEQLRIAIDALAAADVVGVSQRDEIATLWREQARLDAQMARRVAELDTSVEWSVDGSRSAASWLVRNLRLASGEAHHRVRVARQIAQMPIANAAWLEGRISSRHVEVLTSIRHAADADTEFAEFEKYLVDVALTSPPEDVARVGRRWRDALDDELAGTDRTARRGRTPSTKGGARTSRARSTGSGSSTAPSIPRARKSSTLRSGAATSATTKPTTPASRPNNAPTRSSTSSATTSTTKNAASTART
jgi:hypothetical protein